jgi:hypothetical protein
VGLERREDMAVAGNRAEVRLGYFLEGTDQDRQPGVGAGAGPPIPQSGHLVMLEHFLSLAFPVPFRLWTNPVRSNLFGERWSKTFQQM